jgi:hypothetical protein
MESPEAIAAQPPAPRHDPTIPWLPLFALLVLLIYPLSTGPVYKLASKSVIPWQTIFTVYKPLFTVADSDPLFMAPRDHNPPIRRLFSWYIFTVWNVQITYFQ